MILFLLLCKDAVFIYKEVCHCSINIELVEEMKGIGIGALDCVGEEKFHPLDHQKLEETNPMYNTSNLSSVESQK